MRRTILLVAVLLFSSLCFLSASSVFDRDALITHINSVQSHWTAGINDKFASDYNNEAVKRLCGAKQTPEDQRLPIKLNEVHVGAIPAEFDSRQQWPNCPSIREVRDQSDCGSCWAFAAVEAGTDRICIETGKTIHLSATDLLSCCWMCGSGCQGGFPSAAWSYFQSTGVVTGGNYQDYSLCVAYPFPICDHHVNGTYPNCQALNGGNDYNTPSCPTGCDSNSTYPTPYGQDKHKFATSYSVSSDVQQIQQEIMTNGPVEAAFTVYADFPTYKSGVYYHVSGDELGGHAIKILGWGTENGMDYWLVANSWNEQWGDHGFFKIRRGTDECGIEDGVVAGLYQGGQ